MLAVAEPPNEIRDHEEVTRGIEEADQPRP
jgi:hypothetical protein